MGNSSLAVEVIADDSGKWVGNRMRFATEPEALGYASNLYGRWTAVRQTRVVQTDEAVTDTWDTTTRTLAPLPRTTEEMGLTPVTDVGQFVRDITGDAQVQS
jgi:hypothetical protein